MREDGDAEFGGALKELAQTCRGSSRKRSRSALGPIAGQRVADAGRSLLAFPEYAAQRSTESVGSYARDEAGLLAPAAAMRRFAAEVARSKAPSMRSQRASTR